MATAVNLPAGVFDVAQASPWDTRGCTEFDHEGTTYVVVMLMIDAEAEQRVLDAGASEAFLDESQGYKVHWGTKP